MLRWETVGDHLVQVQQQHGVVTYWVDGHARLTIETPAGRVSTTAANLNVEIEDMASRRMKTGVGVVAAAALVTVAVHQGSATFSNDHKVAVVGAGERAESHGFDAPSRRAAVSPRKDDGPRVAMATATSTRERVTVDPDKAYLAQRVTELEAQVEELGGTPDGETPAQRAYRCAGVPLDSECPLLEPDRATLEEMARCKTVWIDFPGFLESDDDGAIETLIRRLEVDDPTMAQKIRRAADRHMQEHRAQLVELFVELGGDPVTAENASVETLRQYCQDQVGPMSDVLAAMSKERAGLAEAPTSPAELPPEQRLGRLIAGIGDAFEDYLAAEVGPEVARELRQRNDGWGGGNAVARPRDHQSIEPPCYLPKVR